MRNLSETLRRMAYARRNTPHVVANTAQVEAVLIREAEYLEEAAEMLEAQEPRLVTESDFNGEDAYGYIPVWTEEKDGDMYWECIPKVAITDPDGIGVLRYWTSRPTAAEREAIPWN